MELCALTIVDVRNPVVIIAPMATMTIQRIVIATKQLGQGEPDL